MSFENFRELLRHLGIIVRPKVAVLLYTLGWFMSLFVVAIIGATFYALAANEWFPNTDNNSTAQAVLTNNQLCAQTKTLTDSMEIFQDNMTASDTELMEQQQTAEINASTNAEREQLFEQEGNAYMQLNNQESYGFQIALLPEAIDLRDELLQRLPTSSVPTTTPDGTPTYELIAFQDQLAGPSPIGDAAVYLEELAKQLCPSQ
jgi:hypothetical protein